MRARKWVLTGGHIGECAVRLPVLSFFSTTTNTTASQPHLLVVVSRFKSMLQCVELCPLIEEIDGHLPGTRGFRGHHYNL